MTQKISNYLGYFFAILALIGCKTLPEAELVFSDGSYQGKVNRDGKKHGFGIYRWMDGSIYEGDYQNDVRHGKGRFLWANGESYVGVYLQDERTGKGIYHWPDGSYYDGDFLVGKRHGKGTYHSADGITYQGEWFDDQQHGQGTITHADGKTIKGIWRKGSLVSKPAELPPSSTQPRLPVLQIEKVSSHIPTADPIIASVPPTVQENKISTPASELNSQSNGDLVAQSNFTETLEKKDLSDPAPFVSTSSPTSTNEAIVAKDEFPNQEIPQPSSAKDIDTPDWSGTPEDAKTEFTTELIDGIDTVLHRKTGIPFTGKMQTLDDFGQSTGELNFKDGRMHGEEIFLDRSGNIIESYIWSNGRPVEK